MPERYEARWYSSSLETGRLRFIRHHRLWVEPRLHDWQLMYTFSGRGRLLTARSAVPSEVGDLFLLAPHTQRAYEPVGSPPAWGHFWVHFQPPTSWRRLLQWPEIERGVHHLRLSTPELRKKVRADLAEMHEVGGGRAVYQEQLALNRLQTALLRSQSVNPLTDRPATDSRVRRAIDLLGEAASRPFDLRTLGRDCGLSERQLFRLFRKATGTTPRVFHERFRIEQAEHLLRETPFSIAEIADQLGFENPFYFSLRFKRHSGYSPSMFRDRYRSGR